MGEEISSPSIVKCNSLIVVVALQKVSVAQLTTKSLNVDFFYVFYYTQLFGFVNT